jgi:hypothetical protein
VEQVAGALAENLFYFKLFFYIFKLFGNVNVKNKF